MSCQDNHEEHDDDIDAGKKSAGELLNGQWRFKIPFFQRAYVWDKNLWERFITDMKDISDNDKKHFMGFITLKSNNKSFGKGHFLIVDGQQRLTTFLLFARALCKVRKEYFDKMNFEYKENQPFLNHNYTDRKIFNKIVSRNDLSDRIKDEYVDSRILECYNYFLEQEDRLKKIDIDKVLKNLSFIYLTLQEDEDEQKIFDTINSLVVSLSIPDLLKNELFNKEAKFGMSSEKFYEETWQEAFEETPKLKRYWERSIASKGSAKTNIEMLLQSYLDIQESIIDGGIVGNAKYRKGHELFDRYKIFLETHKPNRKEFIEELMSYAKVYEEYIKPEYLNEPLKDGHLTQRLNIIIFTSGIISVIPYVLYILKTVKKNEDKKEIFSILETYLMRQMIVGHNASNYNNYFRGAIAAERNSSDLLKNLIYGKEDSEKRSAHLPSNKELKETFEGAAFTNNKYTKIILYFLEHQAKSPEPQSALWHFRKYSLEHIMPKAWSAFWKNLPEGENAIEERNRKIHYIGNLTILTAGLNGRIGHAGWEDRKNGYTPGGRVAECGGLIVNCDGLKTFEKYLKNGEDWNEGTIDKRGKELLRHARKLWPYEPPKNLKNKNN